jgi:hypothetical protein
MNEQLIKYAVCADNEDPYEAHRIRVIFEDKSNLLNTNSNVEAILNKLDTGSSQNYTAWEKATKVSDPYMVEPFLPKHLNIIPKKGELVKIISFGGAQKEQFEYVGPHISTLENTNFDPANRAKALTRFSKLNPNKNNLVKKGFIADGTKNVVFRGRDNVEFILGDNNAVLRTGFQDKTNKRKNTDYSFIQVANFNSGLTITENNENVTIEPTIPIDYVVEFKIDKLPRLSSQDKTIKLIISVYPASSIVNDNGLIGLNTDVYLERKDYLSTASVDLQIVYLTDLAESIPSVINTLLINLDNNKVGLSMPDILDNSIAFSTPNGDYQITDNRTNNNGSAITDRDEFMLSTYLVRVSPSQIDFNNLTNNDSELSLLGIRETQTSYKKDISMLNYLGGYLTEFRSDVQIRKRRPNQYPRIESVPVKRESYNRNIKDSAIITASNKILMVSTKVNSDFIESLPTSYGVTQKRITEFYKKTHPTLRGDLTIQLINELIELILTHGHSVGNTVQNSIDEPTKNKLENIRKRLNQRVNDDLSGGPEILNQFIRIN